MSATSLNLVDISDTRDINAFVIDENILCILLSSLEALRAKNCKRNAFKNLNINATNHKFEQLKYRIKNNIDVLIFTETKLDLSSPSSQFSVDGFAKPFCRDRKKNGAGMMVFVNKFSSL